MVEALYIPQDEHPVCARRDLSALIDKNGREVVVTAD